MSFENGFSTDHLMQFAIMGVEFAKVVLGREEPRLAILNIGTEQDKGKIYIKDTAKLLWIVYISLTVLETVLLYFSGLTIFSAFNHSLTTLSTGGFSTLNSSVSDFSLGSKIIINVFMYLAGVSFILILRSIMSKSLKDFYKSSEFKFYTSTRSASGS